MREKIIEDLKENLPPKRFSHVLRVESLIKKYAHQYGVDTQKASLSALFHDYCKGQEKKYQMKYMDLISDYVMAYDGMEVSKNQNIIHGLYGAMVAKEEYGIDDDELLQGIIFHSTACEDFSNLGKILYLADKLEPHRQYPEVEKLRSLAKKDLDEAFARTLDHSILYLIKEKECISIDSIKCRNQLIQEGRFGRKITKNCKSM